MLLDIERDEAVVNEVDDRVEPLFAHIESAIVVDLVVFGLVAELDRQRVRVWRIARLSHQKVAVIVAKQRFGLLSRYQAVIFEAIIRWSIG